ncbi:protein arginine methyltransferase NDUFAF7 homolog, mitochondrial [Culicoides brevitarsis]|uniref:protein arginine methyltransferase NDUFAF7 homolog, mitochondrial n=1 Tax=Culicoides brevitarsis TaxID=469753 RepID=UPI00307CC259
MNILRKSIYLPLIFRQSTRCMCYKTVKRPDFSDKPRERKIQPNKVDEKPFSLSDHIKARIKFGGPITLAEYMKEVLVNPNNGYYMNRDVFGHQGDFITSPEIGQIFGEMVAIWCLTEYQKLGSPSPLQIVELGPGRGTLMQDILRVMSKFELIKEFSIELVEISPFLSKAQALMLCVSSKEVSGEKHYREGKTGSGVNVRWYRSYDDIPDGFTILLAHEFFDALPINKLLRDGDKWREMLIDIDPDNEKQFRYIQSREETPVSKLFKQLCHKDESRDVVELCLEADRILRNVAKKFEENGGFGLIMDYGHWGEKGDTFRAFKNHKLHDPLVDPGNADLTADVDFRQMQQSCTAEDRLITFGPVEQGTFLQRMGANVRLENLLKNAQNEEQKSALKSGYEILTSEKQMGKRFKFFSMFPAVTKDHLQKFPVSGFS